MKDLELFFGNSNNLYRIKNFEEVCDQRKKNSFSQEDVIRRSAINFSIIHRKVC